MTRRLNLGERMKVLNEIYKSPKRWNDLLDSVADKLRYNKLFGPAPKPEISDAEQQSYNHLFGSRAEPGLSANELAAYDKVMGRTKSATELSPADQTQFDKLFNRGQGK